MAPRSPLDVAQLAQPLGDEEQRAVRLHRETLDGAYPEALLVRRRTARRSGQRGRVDVARADHPPSATGPASVRNAVSRTGSGAMRVPLKRACSNARANRAARCGETPPYTTASAVRSRQIPVQPDDVPGQWSPARRAVARRGPGRGPGRQSPTGHGHSGR
ncbi:hypothetical protein [Streptomyces olivochromogenes]|uniref:hypothetical protein n=1 Tax=Streptomyces olivochromogenes TaxID=1963 RepID=UPI000A7A0DEF